MMSLERCWLAGLSVTTLWLVGCVNTPESYPAPAQHLPYNPQSAARTDFVAASDIYAEKFFVRDILVSDKGEWRWTRTEPELRFFLDSTENRKLVFEFVINETTFKDTGPVTISFFVNKHLLGRERYDKPGEYAFERPVQSDWLRAREETRVLVRVENPWKTPEGPLGILLKRAGIVP
jgi:hypothetical protein